VWLRLYEPANVLQNFIPALLAYLKFSSALHMVKLLKYNQNHNANFLSRLTIEAGMWRLA
jgi:hypothetical protein